MGAIILGLVINMISGGTNKEAFGGAGWSKIFGGYSRLLGN